MLKTDLNRRITKDSLTKWFEDDFWQEKRTLFISEGIYGDVANKFIKQFVVLENEIKPITIYMNCLGGDYHHGMGMFDVISNSESHVTIKVYGSAMSMGSLILQAADTRLVSKNSVVMIHYGYTYTGFDHAITNEKWAEFQKRDKPTMEEIYLNRIKDKHPKHTIDEVKKSLTFDTIFKGQEAVEAGLADGIIGEYDESEG